MNSTNESQKIMSSPTALSLFSGAGGLDIGFSKAGFNIVGCVEIETDFCKTLEANEKHYFSKNCQIFNIDARLFEPDQLSAKKIDFIIGGPPCQSFSAIGRRAGGAQGIDDAQGTLFGEYCRIVKHYQPVGFLFENVRGIISSNKGADWLEIKRAFESIGYELTYKILSTADYGVPQRRERLIMVGTKAGYKYQFPLPLYGPDSKGGGRYIGAQEAIHDLQDPDEPYHSYSGKYGHLLEEVPPGQNYHYFTERMGYPNPVFAWRSRFSDFLYKAHPDEPVRTVVAKLGKYSGPFHWKNRRFTVAEMKRLQGFPDDYVLKGAEARQMQQIGNSVPPLFAEHLAKSVLHSLFEHESEMDLLPEGFVLTFDRAKGDRARTTRRKVTNFPLFEALSENSNAPSGEIEEVAYARQTKLIYDSPKIRRNVESFSGGGGDQFKISVLRDNDTCAISVMPSGTRGKQQQPNLVYKLSFYRPIGNGLRSITCRSFVSGKFLYVVWDAIEDYLKSATSYHTMFDVYGHFTEPHPIFDLQADLFDHSDRFLKFAHHFSEMRNNQQVFHRDVLEDIIGADFSNDDEFIDFIKELRALRFDVRVHQTNTKIPRDHFRCCYPFTLSLSRQVAITWSDVKETEILLVG